MAMGIPRMPAELYFYEPYVQAARARLEEAAWETAWSEGRAMSMEEAIEYGLSEEELAPPAASAAPEEPPIGIQAATLTRREVEIATFVAKGLTNRQIASELSVSEHTVANHVAKTYRC
jgi:DNA-binding NarL/FixJ family response regulator